jgi:hypothetical protein
MSKSQRPQANACRLLIGASMTLLATVPATQSFTTYWWCFRTANGTYHSGWTGWSSFYRSL